MSLTILTEDGELFGTPILNYACGCGAFVTETVLERDEQQARNAMNAHWLAEHPDELAEMGMGPCGQCGQITDHLKMRTEHGLAYVCETHAPNDRLRAVLGGTTS